MNNLIQRFSTIFIFLIINSSFIFSQTINNGEFMFVNKSSNQISVKIYPNGAIFNGDNEYNLYAVHQINGQEFIYPKGPNPLILDPYNNGNYFKRANFDRDVDNLYCDFSLGFGIYRIEINDYQNPIFSFDIDFSDADFCGSNPDYYRRIRIDYNNYNNITYNFIANDGITNFNTIAITSERNIINVWELQGTPHQGWFTQNKGDFSDASIQNEFRDWPINAFNSTYQAQGHINYWNINLNTKISNYDVNTTAGYLRFNWCHFTINSGYGYYCYETNPLWASVYVHGTGSKFTSYEGSTFSCGQGGALLIEDTSSIESYGTNFTGSNNYDWVGIFLLDGPAIINNCTFTNVFRGIELINPQTINFSNISNNTFFIVPDNIWYDKCFGIHFIKIYNASISNNTFHLPTDLQYDSKGIWIENNVKSEQDNNDQPWVSLSIANNTFYDGLKQISLYGSIDLQNVYIYDNIFNNGKTNIECTNIVGWIRDNHISNNNNTEISTEAISLIGCKQNLLNNYVESFYNDIIIRSQTYIHLAPLQINNQFIWYGGKNELHQLREYSTLGYNNWNIDFAEAGSGPKCYVYTDKGKNQFYLKYSSGAVGWHIAGYLPDSVQMYYTNGNCWYLNETTCQPRISLYNINGPINFVWEYPNNCNWDEQIVNSIISDLGNGIYDTVLITQSSNLPPPGTDATLYATATLNKTQKLYSVAIINLKNIINTYQNSRYLESSIYDLYECYVLSDTNHIQNWRNAIFGEFKNFLEDKIQQYENNSEFLSVAFNFILKCEVKMKNYQSAQDGYEFIAENSPDAIERLLSSIHYLEVDELNQGGNGGGQKDNSENLEISNSSYVGKPINEILLSSFNKTKILNKKREKIEFEKSTNISETKAIIEKRNSLKKILENRAKENIRFSNTLSKKDRRDRIEKDLTLLHQNAEKTEKINTNHILESIKCELLQNYPNPFNPVTKINYSIENQVFVTLKIYDILGREVKTLVNEVKIPGNYIVEFNGSELSSGVYFYRIIAGDFNAVKRMVLIK
jgi:hypothetical protein